MPTNATERPDAPAVFRGVPTYFRACCAEARGGLGYDHPGWHLAIHVDGMVEWNEPEERDAKLDELRELLDRADDEGVLAWLRREFPSCMRLVPRRRQRQFLRGVYRAHDDGRVI